MNKKKGTPLHQLEYTLLNGFKKIFSKVKFRDLKKSVQVGVGVNLVFYGDFGLRRGKGEEVSATAEALYRDGILGKVYIRDKRNAKNTKFSKYLINAIPFGNIIPRILSGVKKFLIPSFQSRIWGERVFDFFSSLKLKKDADILYVSAGALRTLLKAKKMGYKVGQHCGFLHPRHNLNLIKEEYSKYGIPFTNTTFLNELENAEQRMKLYDFYIVHSKFTKDNYVENGIDSNTIYINPLGIDLEKFKPLDKYSEERKKTFIFVGSLTLLKGAHYLIEAWKQLDLKDAKLIMCGPTESIDWPLFKKLKEEVKNVEFTGFVDPSDYYHKGSVFIFPSLTESFSRVASEALASGLPVITTPPCSEPMRDGENGFIIPIRDVKALKEKILYFYNNPDKAIEMGKKARKIAEEYNWEKYIERLSEIIKQII